MTDELTKRFLLKGKINRWQKIISNVEYYMEDE